jgi:two-component system response regulator HydG
VGDTASRKVDVRVVAATHVDLGRAMREGRFREDLFYRLSVITLELPALRERPEDIPLLAQHLVHKHAARLGKTARALSPEALEALTLYRWPGNVRELENAIERALVLSSSERLELEDLPGHVRADGRRGGGEVELHSLAHLPYTEAKRLALGTFERRYLSAVLEKGGHNVSEAARMAGLDRSNFRRLLKL